MASSPDDNPDDCPTCGGETSTGSGGLGVYRLCLDDACDFFESYAARDRDASRVPAMEIDDGH